MPAKGGLPPPAIPESPPSSSTATPARPRSKPAKVTSFKRSSDSMKCAATAVTSGTNVLTRVTKPAEAFSRARFRAKTGNSTLMTDKTKPIRSSSGPTIIPRRRPAISTTIATAAIIEEAAAMVIGPNPSRRAIRTAVDEVPHPKLMSNTSAQIRWSEIRTLAAITPLTASRSRHSGIASGLHLGDGSSSAPRV